jgi:hypothetical protein
MPQTESIRALKIAFLYGAAILSTPPGEVIISSIIGVLLRLLEPPRCLFTLLVKAKKCLKTT